MKITLNISDEQFEFLLDYLGTKLDEIEYNMRTAKEQSTVEEQYDECMSDDFYRSVRDLYNKVAGSVGPTKSLFDEDEVVLGYFKIE